MAQNSEQDEACLGIDSQDTSGLTYTSLEAPPQSTSSEISEPFIASERPAIVVHSTKISLKLEDTSLFADFVAQVTEAALHERDSFERPAKRARTGKYPKLDSGGMSWDEKWATALLISRTEIKFELPQDPTATALLQLAADFTIPILLNPFRKELAQPQQLGLTIGNYSVSLDVHGDVSTRERKILARAANIQSWTPKSTAVARCTFAISRKLDFATSYSLVVDILWNDAQILYEPRGKHETLLPLLISEATPQVSTQWSPREFYESVHIPEPDGKLEDEESFGLGCQLFTFQQRAVRWMLRREGVRSSGASSAALTQPPLPYGFLELVDINGRPCFMSPWLKVITTRLDLLIDGYARLRGGLLAEEMGLGKTVEVMALINSNRRQPPTQESIPVLSALRKTGATLIISPQFILRQWESEIQNHAPSFKILVYSGIQRSAEAVDVGALVDLMAEQTVVLTSYDVLANEIWYAEQAPERNLRYARVYERKMSPLVKLDWWRVVLDECQMVENGASAAAKVAQLIVRQNAWAVSGTPLQSEAKDLFGLITFLRLHPYCNSPQLWQSLVSHHRPVFKQLINSIAIRHTKEMVSSEIQLPLQKRVVLTIPFTPVEETHYRSMFQQMCDECGFDINGAPLADSWDPESPMMIEQMRSWLVRLRQLCLHPGVGNRNRRALGQSTGPLREVGKVLQLMIEQQEGVGRTEERNLLMTKLKRGQILEQAGQSQEALRIWLAVQKDAVRIVEETKKDLALASSTEARVPLPVQEGEDEKEGASSHIGVIRMRVRSALEVEHLSTFFAGNAYFQLKSNTELIPADSEPFHELEKLETQSYEKAKSIRQEMLTETYAKAHSSMSMLKSREIKGQFTRIPDFLEFTQPGGIESRNILAKYDQLSDALDAQASQIAIWRGNLIASLTISLLDQDDADVQGDEYEMTTKQQDEVYAYMDVIRAAVVDRHDAMTGQTTESNTKNMATAMAQARKGEDHAPELMLKLLSRRLQIKPDMGELGSLRCIITELRGLRTSLRAQEARVSASSELTIVDLALATLQNTNATQTKALAALEHEVEMFRDTMNARLEYYRQLQVISDAVAPLADELDADTRASRIAAMKTAEDRVQLKISTSSSKLRYLEHLRQEPESGSEARKCIICQDSFEIGALTFCGHSYCRHCLRLWWNQHRNCPTCKQKLGKNDWHSITYKPQEPTFQEEVQMYPSETASPGDSTSIYTDINSATLNQIKTIDINCSYGSKIDTLVRHILWIRANDPGAKAVIFSQFKEFLDVLGTAFSRSRITYTSVDSTGGIEKFKKDLSMECFFLHASAHSSGLNLINATHIFLCEPLINTAIELQAIARVHRIGQKLPTTVWMYLVEDTVEQAIYDISVARRLAHLARRDGEANQTSGSGVEEDLERANSWALQEAGGGTGMMKGRGGGEMVGNDDLWGCLFRRRIGVKGRAEAEGIEAWEMDGIEEMGMSMGRGMGTIFNE